MMTLVDLENVLKITKTYLKFLKLKPTFFYFFISYTRCTSMKKYDDFFPPKNMLNSEE